MTRLDVLKKLTSQFHDEIKIIQDQCPHVDVTAKYGANSGNLSEIDDLYWIDVHCNHCDKQMTYFHNEHPDEYRKYGKYTRN
jgi:hypothetical protein